MLNNLDSYMHNIPMYKILKLIEFEISHIIHLFSNSYHSRIIL